MHVADRPFTLSGLQVGHAVVDAAAPALIESEDYIGAVWRGSAKRLLQSVDGQSGLRHPALQEVAGQTGLGERDHVGVRGSRLDNLANASDVPGNVAFHRLELDEGHSQRRAHLILIHRRHGRIGLPSPGFTFCSRRRKIPLPRLWCRLRNEVNKGGVREASTGIGCAGHRAETIDAQKGAA